MARLECGTVVNVPPDRLFERLIDFEGYPAYSTHLDAVERDGDGRAGTVYAIPLRGGDSRGRSARR